LNSGTQILHSTTSDPEILAICGINSQGKNVVQIINLKNNKVTVEIDGVAGNLSKSVTTTQNENWKEDGIQLKTKNGNNETTLQPKSLNTLVF
jgi:hypothetical protein